MNQVPSRLRIISRSGGGVEGGGVVLMQLPLPCQKYSFFAEIFNFENLLIKVLRKLINVKCHNCYYDFEFQDLATKYLKKVCTIFTEVKLFLIIC